jgi:hypothetical protein
MQPSRRKVSRTTKSKKVTPKSQDVHRSDKPKSASNGHKSALRAPVTVDDVLPPGSWERVAAGVVAAAGGGLLAAAAVGVGPAALAAAAGYLAFRGLNADRKHAGAVAQKS